MNFVSTHFPLKKKKKKTGIKQSLCQESNYIGISSLIGHITEIVFITISQTIYSCSVYFFIHSEFRFHPLCYKKVKYLQLSLGQQ